MKALLSKTPGGPDTLALEDVPEPAPGKGEIRIAVRACGVNFPDSLIIEDKYQIKPPRPFAPGGEVAGVVDAVGEGVDADLVGRKMIGFIGHGGMAEKVVLDARRAAPMPDSMPFEAAAAFVMTYATTIHALKDRAALKAGETLVVLGASGGVGLAAVELGHAMGARVIACASSADKLEAARAHGADLLLDYSRENLREGLRRLGGDAGIDVVYDPVGGDFSEPALRSLNWKGRFLVVGFAAGPIPKIPLNLVLLKGIDVQGVFWGGFLKNEPEGHARNQARLLAMVAEGRLTAKVHGVYPLERAAEALGVLSRREAVGKVLLRPV